MGINTNLDVLIDETCDEIYDDDVYRAIEIERRVNELCCIFCDTGIEITRESISALEGEWVVEYIDIHEPDDREHAYLGLRQVDVYFVNGDMMVLYG